MIDAHAHIHDPKFDADREAVLVRAKQLGIEHILTIGTSIEESYDAIKIAKEHPGYIFATVAVHPHEYTKLPSQNVRNAWKKELEVLAQEKIVVAVGECGLDYHAFGGFEVSEEQKSAQKEGFLDHLHLAKKVQKPLVIHARESYKDVFEIIQEYRDAIPFFILHCYQGDREITKQFLHLSKNIFFSFAGNITYPVKKSLEGSKNDPREVLQIIPLERILVETDCPYLAPQSQRGKRNEPTYVFETAEFIAKTKKESKERVMHMFKENTQCVFSL